MNELKKQGRKNVIKIAKMRENATIPQFQTIGAAGVDLHACISHSMIIAPNESVLIPTGLAMAIPFGWTGLIMPRSGLGHKHGIVLGNLIGVIDSDYRGEIQVSLWNRSSEVYKVNPNDRIAQMCFLPLASVGGFIEVDSLSNDTTRNSAGFGTTGI
jgi:dUTP pyrophosphatase